MFWLVEKIALSETMLTLILPFQNYDMLAHTFSHCYLWQFMFPWRTKG